MSVKSNLDLARKYSWNASMAKQFGDIREADRYDAMAKMSMIDAAADFNNQSRINTIPHRYIGSSGIKEHPIAFAIGVGISFVILSVVSIIGIMI